MWIPGVTSSTVVPCMIQTYSCELTKDAKSWLLATKGEQCMPPPPPPPKKTPKKKVGGVDVEDFNEIPTCYVYGKSLVWLHILTEITSRNLIEVFNIHT